MCLEETSPRARLGGCFLFNLNEVVVGMPLDRGLFANHHSTPEMLFPCVRRPPRNREGGQAVRSGPTGLPRCHWDLTATDLSESNTFWHLLASKHGVVCSDGVDTKMEKT